MANHQSEPSLGTLLEESGIPQEAIALLGTTISLFSLVYLFLRYLLPGKKIVQDQMVNNYSQPSVSIINEILEKMFPNVRVHREMERKSGFSQGGVYRVRRYRGSSELLPAAVKIAPKYVIEKEKKAYHSYIEQHLPRAVNLHQSVYTHNKKWGGLDYQWVSEGIRETKNLYEYLRSDQVTLSDVRKTLSYLFDDYMDKLWKESNPYQGFSILDSYDRVLPVNLVIEPIVVLANVDPIRLSPKTINEYCFNLREDAYIRLENFQVVEVSPYEIESSTKDYILNYPASEPCQPPRSCRLRLDCKKPFVVNLSVGQKPKVIAGKVVNTRARLLKLRAQQVLGMSDNHLNLDEPVLPLTHSNQTTELPNPLQTLVQILYEPMNVRVGPIHGDLQIENILVDPKTGDVSLIDFAEARNDHVLHDLLRLETSLVTKWLAKILQEHQLPTSTIYPFYKQLHCATFHSTPFQPRYLPTILEKPFVSLCMLRDAAIHLLLDKRNYQEYYNGLTIYLLGALKFKELEPFAHQVAFWGAATSQHLSSNKVVECEDFFTESTP